MQGLVCSAICNNNSNDGIPYSVYSHADTYYMKVFTPVSMPENHVACPDLSRRG